MEKHRQFLYALIASAVVTAMIGAGFLRREDRWAQDWIFQRQGSTTTDIVIIGIDEEALEELGPYNTWDRNVMASALEALAADPDKKPAVTAIDVLYTGHTSMEADLRLAAAAQMYLQSPTSDWEPGEADDGADFLKEAADGDPLYYIPYTGRPGDFYDGVSIAQVIRGEVPADYWAGRIVLIGPYAVGLQDAYFTPIDKGEQMYGVEIQANIIQSFLEKNVKKEIPDAPQLAVVFVLCAASMVLFLNQLVLNASLSAGLLAVLCPVGTVNLYKVGFVTHPLWGAVGVAAAYVLAMVGHYGRTVRERQALAGAGEDRRRAGAGQPHPGKRAS
ncbi:MAG: CHASE2 domain-containing protein [Lachnospiraceae bacterium]